MTDSPMARRAVLARQVDRQLALEELVGLRGARPGLG